MTLPPHLQALRDEALGVSCIDYAERQGWDLARGIDRSGPCPKCGGTDRFSIHTRKNTFLCRRCEIAGANVIDLVMKVEDLDFVPACEKITGRRADSPVDEARAEQLRHDAQKAADKRAADAAEYREKARRAGYVLWRDCSPDPARPILLEYLRIRGLLTSDLIAVWPQIKLKQHDSLAYVLPQRSGPPIELARTPAMVAAVQSADGYFGAAHRTWLDLDQPKGKLVAIDPAKGEPVDPKKGLGAKQGGAIRLFTPEDPRRIIMGEGIETTLTPLAYNFEPQTAYWAGVDLGNMCGKAARDAEGKRQEDRPDMDDLDCWQVPEWCHELIYLGETESGGRNTDAKLIRGLRRHKRLRELARKTNPELPPLVTRFVEAPESGGDINDLVMPPSIDAAMTIDGLQD